MSASTHRPLLRRTAPWLFLILLLVLGWAAALTHAAWRLQEAALAQGRTLVQVHARHLEQHFSLSLQAVQLTAMGLQQGGVAAPVSSFDAYLADIVAPMPALRSLSLVDSQGRVQASSNPQNVGVLMGQQHGFAPAHERTPATVLQLGSPWRGHDIHDPQLAPEAATLLAQDALAVPAMMGLRLAGQNYTLVAVLNPDYFVGRLSAALPDIYCHVDWLRHDGLVLMSSDDEAGATVGHLDPDLQRRLQQAAHGSYETTQPQRATLVSYHSSDLYPVLVRVHLHRQKVLAQWRSEIRQLLLVSLPLLLVLLAGAGLLLRYQLLRQRDERKHERSRRLAASVFESNRDAIIVTDTDANILVVNKAFEKLTGYAAAEVLGRNPRVLSSGLQGKEFYDGMWQQVLATGHWSGQLTNKRRDGSTYLARLTIQAVMDADGRLAHYCGTQFDLTPQQAQQQRLQLAASVFDSAAEGIMITDPAGQIVAVNPAFVAITGYSRDEVMGRNASLLSSGHQSRDFYAGMWQALLEHGSWSGEVWNRRKDGAVYVELLRISAVRDEDGRTLRYVALFSDITKQKAYEDRLVQMAHFDALTGLPNRMLLSDRLRQAMAQCARTGLKVAVVMIDLDGFKTVNDRHGHDAGDRLLVALSQHMRGALRDGDTLARLGGDEFVAVLAGIQEPEDCVSLLERLLQASTEPVHAHGASVQVSASLGVAFFAHGDDIDADQLLRQADQAMYQAKLSGKKRYHFFNAVQELQVRQRHATLEQLQVALEQRQFLLYYQPKVNMRTGALLGMEALIRWQHPTDGLLLPGQFLPALHSHDLLLHLGQWVLEEAVAQMERWLDAGVRVPVSVNVDAQQLHQGDFMAWLRALLARHPKVAASDLELEILETSALLNMEHVASIIKSCQTIGVTFALDDFGTGYSSLNYLRHLPTRQIKIDKGFVRDMLEDPEDLAILEGVIALSATFRREVIAEGVETTAHGTMLLRLGCEHGQGYAIARPMPAAQVLAWYGDWQQPQAWRQTRPMRREHLPLLFARVEHRAWVAALLAYLQQGGYAPADLHVTACHLGAWLEQTEGGLSLAHLPEYQKLLSVHQDIHDLGSAIIAAAPQEGQQHLQRLGTLQELLLQRLNELEAAVVANEAPAVASGPEQNPKPGPAGPAP